MFEQFIVAPSSESSTFASGYAVLSTLTIICPSFNVPVITYTPGSLIVAMLPLTSVPFPVVTIDVPFKVIVLASVIGNSVTVVTGTSVTVVDTPVVTVVSFVVVTEVVIDL